MIVSDEQRILYGVENESLGSITEDILTIFLQHLSIVNPQGIAKAHAFHHGEGIAGLTSFVGLVACKRGRDDCLA